MSRKPGELQASLRDRWQAKVSPEALSGCWLWTGAVKELGYGVIGLGTRQQGVAKAHRVAWELHNGPIPAGMNVLHYCDMPGCVNPNHLFLGTLSDNAKDCVAKGRNFVPDNRGERASWGKLKLEDVAEIKTRKMTGRAYAEKFGVSKSAVFQIWRGINWRHQ
jgi:hypothetical protein